MKDTDHLKEMIRELLGSQKLSVLATQMQGQPYTTLIAFAATEDLKYLLFATNRATRKYANIMADHRVALLIDSRANLETYFTQAAAVTSLGSAWEVHGQERQRYLSLYLQKHPYLEDFVSSPDTALLRLQVDKYLLVTRFQEVRELSLS